MFTVLFFIFSVAPDGILSNTFFADLKKLYDLKPFVEGLLDIPKHLINQSNPYRTGYLPPRPA